MNSFPTDNFTSFDHANHPSLPLTIRQLGSLYEESPTFINDLFPNDPRVPDLGDFNADTRVVHAPRVLPHGTLPRHVKPLLQRRLINIRRRRHGRPGAIPEGSPSQSVGFKAPPQANILATATPQLSIDPFGGVYTLNTHPSASPSAGSSSTMFDRDVPRYHVGSDMLVPQATPQANTLPQSNTHAALVPQLTVDVFNNTSHASLPSAYCPSGSSSATFENGGLEQPSFSRIQNVSIPMTSGPAPSGLAPSPSPSLIWMTPIIPTSDPVTRPWDANTTSTGPTTIPALTSTAPRAARAEPQQVPVSRCPCCKRVHPVVRVNDVEWVRPDMMKMVLYFNWSSNAETEVHESWGPEDLTFIRSGPSV